MRRDPGVIDDVPVIAIDGPNAAGKGTICQLLARKLGFHLLDSGALYRLVAVAAIDKGTALEDVDTLAQQAYALDASFQAAPQDGTDAPGAVKITLAGADVTQRIRTEQVGNQASLVAAIIPVREALLERQRAFRRPPGLVADGRDMGSVVFPDAAVKIFLTASAQVRAVRRHNQLREQGIDVNLAALSAEIEERDRRDRERPISPVRPAKGAVIVDTSEHSTEAVFAQVCALVKATGIEAAVVGAKGLPD